LQALQMRVRSKVVRQRQPEDRLVPLLRTEPAAKTSLPQMHRQSHLASPNSVSVDDGEVVEDEAS
jgi:hypothetical protein